MLIAHMILLIIGYNEMIYENKIILEVLMVSHLWELLCSVLRIAQFSCGNNSLSNEIRDPRTLSVKFGVPFRVFSVRPGFIFLRFGVGFTQV